MLREGISRVCDGAVVEVEVEVEGTLGLGIVSS